jgi:hypothetical protein
LCAAVQRRTKVTAIVFGGFVFIGMTLLLTRALVGAGNERAEVLALLRAQAAGDVQGVIEQLPECAMVPVCGRIAGERTARLKRPGEVEILTYKPSVQVAMVRTTAFARVAWRTELRQDPVVQCVRVEREGPLNGAGVRLISIGDPIGGEAGCG